MVKLAYDQDHPVILLFVFCPIFGFCSIKKETEEVADNRYWETPADKRFFTKCNL